MLIRLLKLFLTGLVIIIGLPIWIIFILGALFQEFMDDDLTDAF